MKISVVTVVFNRAGTIAQAVKSVQAQTHPDVEHVIIDGASTDGTTKILKELARPADIFVSEPDKGIYDALNKGLSRATGDVVGMMHSDDFYTDENVLSDVAAAFARQPEAEAAYGDLDYVSADDPARIVRHWVSGTYDRARLRQGWMPPHPTLYVRRAVIEEWGGFDTSFRIAADYDQILRYFGKAEIDAAYVPRVLVKMRAGGESNASLKKLMRKSREDLRALNKNGVGGVGTLVSKNVSKIPQLFRRPANSVPPRPVEGTGAHP